MLIRRVLGAPLYKLIWIQTQQIAKVKQATPHVDQGAEPLVVLWMDLRHIGKQKEKFADFGHLGFHNLALFDNK